MRGFVRRVVLDRAGGERPAPPRALAAALAVGGTVAAVTYRLLRHEAKR